MPEQNRLTLEQRKKSLSVRGILLFVQILLPLGVYFALSGSNSLAAALLAGAFFLSMLFLVWLG